MVYDPYPDQLEGRLLHNWLDYELQWRLTRAVEQAADAMKYGGPAHVEMYLSVVRKIVHEQNRRQQGRLGYDDLPRLWAER